MIQVSTRDWNGSIRYCRIHDLLRDLAIEKAKENNFLGFISNQCDKYCSLGTIRRATLHCNQEDIMEYTGPNLRSLLYCGDNMPDVSRFRFLKVLCQISSGNGPSSWNISKQLTQLRYLGNFLSSGGFHCELKREFWSSISHMRNLQTLHIPDYQTCPSSSAADCIWDIKTLRHVILQGKFLQTLKTVRVRESWLAKGWPKMPIIRVLWLQDLPLNYSSSFQIFLGELHHLTSLHITVSSIEYQSSYEMLDMSVLPSYNHMQSLVVEVKLILNQSMTCRSFEIHLFPIHLIKLKLCNSEIKEDPMPVLEKLKYLRSLILYRAYDGKQFSCSAGGFPRLEYVRLNCLIDLEDWKVEKGGMPLLKEICIRYCRQLVAIPELQYMNRLNKLTLEMVLPDLPKKLRGEESYKIKHIPFIDIKCC